MEVMSSFTCFSFQFSYFLSVQFSAVHFAVRMQSTHDPDNDSSILAQENKLPPSPCVIIPCSQARQSDGDHGLPGRSSIHFSRRLLALNGGDIEALTLAVRQLGVGSQDGARRSHLSATPVRRWLAGSLNIPLTRKIASE